MIIIAVLRVALSKLPGSLLAPSGVTDTVWVFFWQGVEAAVAIIMVSLTTFRSIFGQESRERSNRRSANNSFGSRISAAKFALLNKSPGQTTSSFTTQHSNPDRPVSLISAPPPQMQETNLAIGPSVINSRRLTPHFTSSPPQPMFPLSPPMLPPTVYRPMSSSNAVSPEDYHLPATTYRPGFSRPGTAHRRSSLSFKRRHSRHPSRSSQNQQILSSSAFSPTMTGTTLAPSNPTSPSAHALPPIRSPLSSPRKQNWTNPTALARVGELESRALEWQRNGRFVEGNPNLLNQITEVRSPRSGASTPKLTVARRGDGDEGKIQWKIVEKLGDD